MNLSIKATLHCLLGCAVGEILGMVIGAHFGIHDLAAVILSILLAFVFGYSFSLIPLLKHMPPKNAFKLALASDTLSITTMEVVDNLIMLLIPGAMSAGLFTFLFWGSLSISLIAAFIVTVPVNYWLIKRGRGHALVHTMHKM